MIVGNKLASVSSPSCRKLNFLNFFSWFHQLLLFSSRCYCFANIDIICCRSSDQTASLETTLVVVGFECGQWSWLCQGVRWSTLVGSATPYWLLYMSIACPASTTQKLKSLYDAVESLEEIPATISLGPNAKSGFRNNSFNFSNLPIILPYCRQYNFLKSYYYYFYFCKFIIFINLI